MAGVKGRSKTGGRKKGTPNKRTREFLEVLEEENFDPTRALIRSYRLAMRRFRDAETALDRVKDAEPEEKMVALQKAACLMEDAPQFLKIAQAAAGELMQYATPKRKAIEFKNPGGGDDAKGGVLIFMPSNGRERKAS